MAKPDSINGRSVVAGVDERLAVLEIEVRELRRIANEHTVALRGGGARPRRGVLAVARKSLGAAVHAARATWGNERLA